MTLAERIKEHEGCSLEIYSDILGFSTIGYGHKCSSAEIAAFKDGISQEKADALFDRDFALATAQAASISGQRWPTMGEARQGVIIEMVFQLGMSGVLKFKRMWAAIDAGDYAQAAVEMRDSEWRKQTFARCMELAEIMERGEA